MPAPVRAASVIFSESSTELTAIGKKPGRDAGLDPSVSAIACSAGSVAAAVGVGVGVGVVPDIRADSLGVSHSCMYRSAVPVRSARVNGPAVDAVGADLQEHDAAEGKANRLKAIKRQMYGRGSLDLLRKRVIHHSA